MRSNLSLPVPPILSQYSSSAGLHILTVANDEYGSSRVKCIWDGCVATALSAHHHINILYLDHNLLPPLLLLLLLVSLVVSSLPFS
jgi:hypothetical protein